MPATSHKIRVVGSLFGLRKTVAGVMLTGSQGGVREKQDYHTSDQGVAKGQ